MKFGGTTRVQLPAGTILHTSSGINQVQVRTSSTTEFEGVSRVSSLVVGSNHTLPGLFFKAAGDPILLAKKIRKPYADDGAEGTSFPERRSPRNP